MHTLLLINEAANNGTAARKWASIASDVLALLPAETEVISFRPGFNLDALLRTRLTPNKPLTLLSAGGDGSIHYVLNSLMRIQGESLTNLSLGGIGLGSSNDFHKPIQQTIRGIPVRLDSANTIRADVGRVSYERSDGRVETRYFLINASLGITAQANHLFNEGDWFIRRMKNRFVSLTINYTALKTILLYRDQSIRLYVNGSPVERLQLTNLNLLKNPHVSGSFWYDQAIRPDDGQFSLNYCHDLTLPETLRLMTDLQQGRFVGHPKRVSAFVRHLHIQADKELPLEMDGEIVLARQLTIDLLPHAIQLLT
jgi:diacylglycerol kinase (ATP)